jgi:uncharacterized membrane protein YcaP (DUF421 family)
MEKIEELLGVGVDPKELSILNVSLRGVVVLVVCIALVRLADRRFMSKKSPLDVVLGFVLASVMARAVNGSAALVPTIAAGLVIVLVHRGISHLAMWWHNFGVLVKGRREIVIENGQVNHDVLRQNAISEQDLLEDLSLNGKVDKPSEVERAYLERNGQISVIQRRERD